MGAGVDPRKAGTFEHRVLLPRMSRVEDDRMLLGYQCASSRMTIAVAADHTVFWVGDDRIIYRAEGFIPLRVSHHGVEEALRKASDVSDVRAAREEERHARAMARELSHRIKNIFAVVSSLITLSARRDPDLRYFAQEMTDKIAALGRAHEFVAPTGMVRENTLHGLLDQIFAPYNSQHEQRITVTGSNPTIQGRAATPLALVFHELATNSAKYGVLANEEGVVDVTISHADHDMLRIEWHEPGVAPQETGSEGFGSRLLKMSVEGQMQGRIDRQWSDDGLSVVLDLSLAALAG